MNRILRLFYWNPSKEDLKFLNDDVALEIVCKLDDVMEEFDSDYKKCIPIINKSLSQLVKKDKELALAILNILKERDNEINQKIIISRF